MRTLTPPLFHRDAPRVRAWTRQVPLACAARARARVERRVCLLVGAGAGRGAPRLAARAGATR
eukprot:3560650-Pleurochrysis_carterae.AAC.1